MEWLCKNLAHQGEQWPSCELDSQRAALWITRRRVADE